MVYDLDIGIDRERFKRRVNVLFERRKVVECTECKPKRTSPQNRYLHAILGEFAMQSGYTLEDVKREIFKIHCNAQTFTYKVYDNLLKRDVERLRSSADIDTAEMTTSIERFRNWAALEAGIKLPSPDEEDYIAYIEREMQHNKVWI